ncbi:hypothetical protein HOLleu_14186 [Holothuria leucospilota]|uniref:RING-type domain-containing protein n=1 Tax=Holothuria leucospilota TaxID=206669 RepID=A0A9Q1HBK4_HOLLE|nr:hypothetical protein HOLleu_14186 [Holothuria leucospilota]
MQWATLYTQYVTDLYSVLVMASNYFDEHNCEPTPDGGPEVHTLLHWARLLLSDVRQFYLQNEGFGFPDELRKAPPASKEFVESLPEVTDSLDKKCPICLNEYEPGVTVKKLPCDHHFHCSCIVPWLKQVSAAIYAQGSCNLDRQTVVQCAAKNIQQMIQFMKNLEKKKQGKSSVNLRGNLYTTPCLPDKSVIILQEKQCYDSREVVSIATIGTAISVITIETRQSVFGMVPNL